MNTTQISANVRPDAEILDCSWMLESSVELEATRIDGLEVKYLSGDAAYSVIAACGVPDICLNF